MNIFKNIEDHKDFNIDPEWYKNRKEGISCYYRVKNEGEFIKPSILSIIDWVDEVIVALQPSEDNTREMIESIDSHKIKILDYPFDLLPNGPGFMGQNPSSVHCKTYYYNWTLSKTTYDWALKWDGDMVALPNMEQYVKRDIGRRFYGHEIVKVSCENFWSSKIHPTSNAAPSGLFKVRSGLSYLNGEQTHRFNKPEGKYTGNSFLHFKWCKKYFDDIWQKDWENIPKFQNLCKRAIAGDKYEGDIPQVLLPFLKDEMGFKG